MAKRVWIAYAGQCVGRLTESYMFTRTRVREGCQVARGGLCVQRIWHAAPALV